MGLLEKYNKFIKLIKSWLEALLIKLINKVTKPINEDALERKNWYKFTSPKEYKRIYYFCYDFISLNSFLFDEKATIFCSKHILLTSLEKETIIGEIGNGLVLKVKSTKQLKKLSFSEQKWVNECLKENKVIKYENYINSHKFKLEEVKEILGIDY